MHLAGCPFMVRTYCTLAVFSYSGLSLQSVLHRFSLSRPEGELLPYLTAVYC